MCSHQWLENIAQNKTLVVLSVLFVEKQMKIGFYLLSFHNTKGVEVVKITYMVLLTYMVLVKFP